MPYVGRVNDTPILIGGNSDEGSPFIRGPGDPKTFGALVESLDDPGRV